tara:strand:+ start:161 stop:838 length:678 start_codon:yes stop_codon:yes gene_type:complete
MTAYKKPFPHLILKNFYNKKELNLIWEELNFYTKPNKLFTAKDFGAVVGKTNSHAIALNLLYSPKFESISNILTVNRKALDFSVLKEFAELDKSCKDAICTNNNIVKVRYYHDKEYYKPHIDSNFQFLSFSYFYKKPKKFNGGELIFPDYDYKYKCDNNSIIIFPATIKHGVTEVSINQSDYYEGYGRYCISNFFSKVTQKVKTKSVTKNFTSIEETLAFLKTKL